MGIRGIYGRVAAVVLTVLSLSGELRAQGPARNAIPFGSLAGGTNHTTITAQTLDFDYKKNVAVFQKNVVVESGSMRMQSDRLTVIFAGTNQLKTIEAEGNVVFQHPQGTGNCRKAVYTGEDGMIVLTGEAVLRMRQAGSSNVIQGDPITFLVRNDELQSVRARQVRMEHKTSESGGARKAPKAGQGD